MIFSCLARLVLNFHAVIAETDNEEIQAKMNEKRKVTWMAVCQVWFAIYVAYVNETDRRRISCAYTDYIGQTS